MFTYYAFLENKTIQELPGGHNNFVNNNENSKVNLVKALSIPGG
jgi:hypothetical protein